MPLAIPDYQEFLTPEELHESSVQLVEEFPQLAQLREIGTSTEGRSIELLTIGNGPKAALFLGAPHPNEPIGTLTLDFLSRLLCERQDLREELGYTFLIVKVSDPDGLTLNTGWLKEKFSPLTYALNYYRPPQDEQVEWGFPIHYKTLRFTTPPAETQAVMKLMEQYRPTFYYSLHNASFCG
ncbi:MAG: M14 family zinc carboxypeptidase, partial [Terriglobia bacterium]